jgi:hypothetical protein
LIRKIIKMTISDSQHETLQAFAQSSSILSILGSTSILLRFAYVNNLLSFTQSTSSSTSSLHSFREKVTKAWEEMEITDRLVIIMSALDICASSAFAVGDGAYEGEEEDDTNAACTAQGFFIQFFSLSTVLFNSCMAHNLYSWIVLKRSSDTLLSSIPYYLAVSIALPFLLSLVRLSTLLLSF